MRQCKVSKGPNINEENKVLTCQLFAANTGLWVLGLWVREGGGPWRPGPAAAEFGHDLMVVLRKRSFR